MFNMKKLNALLIILLILSLALNSFQYIKINSLSAQNEKLSLEIKNLKEEKVISGEEINALRKNLSILNSSLFALKTENEKLNYSKIEKSFILGVEEGEGVPMPLETEVKNGRGRILTCVEGNVVIDYSVQKAMRFAIKAAERETGVSLADKDVIFKITSDKEKTYIVGESAGAIFALTVIAAITSNEINESVVITGTILPSGKIGNVTGVREKAEAAKKVDARLMLVPSGQKIEINGIEIKEVSNLKDAEKYIFKAQASSQ